MIPVEFKTLKELNEYVEKHGTPPDVFSIEDNEDDLKYQRQVFEQERIIYDNMMKSIKREKQ